ncbi:hypothetical protein DFH05DRAFT_195908 [Lentinula detonsa]|uniref:Uncharacterized protein n=1 Tax=Lentinula detonsa TaxID=2804962 RepID=A0A9W8PD51_9AGAR|nr:hypothetical protein DFH05DRAFT_195908 [Lentinula detonsa]
MYLLSTVFSAPVPRVTATLQEIYWSWHENRSENKVIWTIVDGLHFRQRHGYRSFPDRTVVNICSTTVHLGAEPSKLGQEWADYLYQLLN